MVLIVINRYREESDTTMAHAIHEYLVDPEAPLERFMQIPRLDSHGRPVDRVLPDELVPPFKLPLQADLLAAG